MDSSLNSAAVAASGGGNGVIIPQTNDASATTAAEAKSDDPKQNLNQVINSIHKTLGLIHQLYLTVSSFNVASQLPLLQRLNSLVLELDNMTKMAEKCNIQVPMQVVNLIDDGKNPDEFTKDVLNECIAKNQITKGKADAFKGLRRHLLEELEQSFPDEVESYREIRAASAATLGGHGTTRVSEAIHRRPQERGKARQGQRKNERSDSEPFGVLTIITMAPEPEKLAELRKKIHEGLAELKRLAQAQSMLPNGDVKVKSEL